MPSKGIKYCNRYTDVLCDGKGQFNNGRKQESTVKLIFCQKKEKYVSRSRSNESGNTQYFSSRAFHVCVHLLISQFRCHDLSCIRSHVAKTHVFLRLLLFFSRLIRLIVSKCVSRRNRLICGAAGAVDESVFAPTTFITQKKH